MQAIQVNFLVIGAQKAGTTALASFLSGHPEICLAPEKEVHYFDNSRWSRRDAPDRAGYHSRFPNFAGQAAVGEATPSYLYLPECLPQIRSYNPGMKLIVLLREPVGRAWSHYWMERGRYREWLPFSLAVRLEPLRLFVARWLPDPKRTALRTYSYLDRGFYSRQITRMLSLFPREQMLFLKSEDLREHHEATLRSVLRFLGVAETDVPPARKVFEGRYRAMDASLKRRLKRRFRTEVDTLEGLTGLELSSWRE